MSYIIRVFLEDRIWNLDLESFDQITIGSGSQDTVTVRELDESQIRIIRDPQDNYLISGLFLARIRGETAFPVSEDILEEDNLYRVSGGKTLEITVHPKQENSATTLMLSHFDRIQIGRNRMKNDIVLTNKRTSSVHCEIVREGDAYFLRDLNSTNGTYLNNRLIDPHKEEKLYDGDVICLSIYRLYYVGGMLSFYNTGEDLQLNVRSREPSKDEETDLLQRLAERDEEPGLITSATVQTGRIPYGEAVESGKPEETRVGTEFEVERILKETVPEAEAAEDAEVTQVGSEEQIEKMLEKERRRQETAPEAKEPEDAEVTQVGSEEQIEKMLEKERRRQETAPEAKEPEDADVTQVGSDDR